MSRLPVPSIIVPTGPGRTRSATGPPVPLSAQSPTSQYVLNPLWFPSEESLATWDKYTAAEGNGLEQIQASFCRHATKTVGRQAFNMDNFAAYLSAAHSVRDRLIERWNATQTYHSGKNPKRVYYMSLEFLLGRSFDNAMLNMNIKENYSGALEDLGFRLEDLIPEEIDAALGNGGLGRLAACFMDSLASLDYPAWGYGIRYTYGIFKQLIVDGYQSEYPDYWLNFGNPWEIERLDVSYEIRFRGYVNKITDANGRVRFVWEGGEKVLAVAYDNPIPGSATKNCINIRLWSAKAINEFDFAAFNEGNYDQSVAEQKNAENITAVLYPNDNHMVGKVLRLKQQYLFVSATLQDIIRRFKKTRAPWSQFPNQVSIQLNDTHPTLGIAELQRILVDEEGLLWDDAWDIVTHVYSFTNHTVLPEALERWPVPMIQDLLPRLMMIIFDINLYFLQKVERLYPGDRDRLRRMSIIEEGFPQYVKMAYLGVVGSHTVNGVAALHSNLIKTALFQDFVEYFGDSRFTNVTNGVTPRRWLHQANPELAELITETLGSDKWLKDLSLLANIKPFAEDAAFRSKWMAIKYHNKARLALYIKTHCKVDVSPDALFDIQCKRFHEYKRQFMNILGVIHRYQYLKKLSKEEIVKVVPKVVIFSGKSAPGYYVAKLMIKLINNVSQVINNDPDTAEYLKLIFIQNYNVSVRVMIPASDISQHISTAGTEASGTSNMKFVLNGGLIVGTVDGANIEIAEEVGEENIWLFGTLTPDVEEIRHQQMYRPSVLEPRLAEVVASIQRGDFGDSVIFEPLLSTLTAGHDYYIINKDFASYLETLAVVDKAFLDKDTWARKSILAAASMGKFSSDRSIKDYAENIWKIKPLPQA